MVENKKSDSVFNAVIDKESNSGDVLKRTIIDLSPYDTSQMEGYKEGDAVYTGYTCQIRVQKLVGKGSRAFVNIDPSDKQIRKALSDMYAKFDELTNSK